MEVLEQACNLINETQNPRRVFAKFATGVCIVLVPFGEEQLCGLTINSFSSVSLNPLLVSFSIKTQSVFYTKISEHIGSLSINILHEEQREVSNSCAKSGGGKFVQEEVKFYNDFYCIPQSMACIGCTIYKKVVAGDHTLFICNVNTLLYNNIEKPLLFFNSQYRTL